MMRLLSSAIALSVVAMLCVAAGSAAAQEIIPATPTPAAATPRWLSRLWPFSLPASAPHVPAPASASTPTPTPLSTQLPVVVVPASTAAVQRDTVAGGSPDEGPSWSELTAAERAALGPLVREWAALDGNGKQKWLRIATRMRHLSAVKQARMQRRMVEWVNMTPQQRAQVRLHFEQARQAVPHNRRQSWEAYLALPADQRQQLARRAAMAASSVTVESVLDADRHSDRAAAVWRDGAQTKSNIVVGPTPAIGLRPVAPAVVQVQPGATTTPMSSHPTPPAHQRAGLPKIVATPEFVDRATLLPQRGAQGAAMHAVSASEPVPGR